VLQLTDILKSKKALLFATTALVVTGCNTTPDESVSKTQDQQSTPVEATTQYYSNDLTPDRMMRIAERAWKKGNPSTAMRLYSMASQKRPKDPEPLMAMADILRKSKRNQQATDLYRQIAAKFPKIGAPHSGIGYILLSEDKPYMAVKSFESAVELENNNAKSLGGLALALDTAGEHDKAQDYYRLAIKSAPNNLTYQNNLALSLALIGRTEQAIAMLEIITAHPKATARHRQNLALVYGMAGKSADAMRYSRMDLSERDARNNALYFQALNQTGSPAVEQDQVYAMAAKSYTEKSATPTSEGDVYTNIATRSETTTISTSRVIPTEPTLMAQHQSQIYEAPQYVAAPRAAETVIALNLQNAEQTISTTETVVTPAPVVPVQLAQMPAPTIVETPNEIAAFQNIQAVVAEKTTTVHIPEINAVAVTPAPINPVPIAVEQTITPEAVAKISYKQIPDFKLEKASFTPPALSNSYTNQDTIYYVQLASFRTAERARIGWAQLKKKHSKLLGSHEPVFAVANLGEEKGTFFRVRVGGFAGKSKPAALCDMLKDQSQDCYLPQVKLDARYSIAEAQYDELSQSVELSIQIADIEPSINRSEQIAKDLNRGGRSTAYIAY
jgi:Flp pilus assembly protein TadD